VLLLLLIGFGRLQKSEINPAIVALFTFTLLCAGYFTLISPNYGSASRYRVFYWFWWIWFGLSQVKSLRYVRRLLAKN
jgi:hypothetical protein